MPDRPHRVGLVLLPEAPIFELSLPLEVFGEVRPELHDPWYELHLIAPDRAARHLGRGFVASQAEGLAAMGAMDTVIVPATHGAPAAEVIPTRLGQTLRAAHARGARVVSICTGAFVLASAGLLTGRRVTTHWMHAAELVRRYPGVRFVPDVLYLEDDGIFTSAGSAAGLDLCLHLVALDFGARVANALGRRLVVPPHREGGQAQYVEQPVVKDGDLSLAPVLAWAEEHLAEPITVDRLAAHACMSVRTLARRFELQLGTSPLRWLIQRRVQAAREQLEATDAGLERIAEQCGFGSAQNLRLHFSRVTGVSPAAYRRAFRTQAA
jgi:AraC family transcriptional regulator, transcriptional activator FtrA